MEKVYRENDLTWSTCLKSPLRLYYVYIILPGDLFCFEITVTHGVTYIVQGAGRDPGLYTALLPYLPYSLSCSVTFPFPCSTFGVKCLVFLVV